MERTIKGEDKGNESWTSKDDDPVIEEELMKPFRLGWKREVVMRVITDSCNCDIYYYHPSGKKLRSMAEVKANLTDGLTPECFTFKKKPLNVSSEIVRSAVIRGQNTKKVKPSVRTVIRTHSSSKVRQKVRTLRKTEKVKPTINLQSGTRRQMLMKKKEKLQRILDIKKLKKSKIVSEKKSSKKAVAEKAPKEPRKYTKTAKRQNKFNHVQCKVPESSSSSSKLKFDCVAGNRKRDCNDLRSIVQRNIGRYREYREMRKRQMKESLQESDKGNKKSYKVVRRPRSSEALSTNLEIYFKPLEKGWRRELVYRVNGPDAAGRSDVYYFHPSGKKLRSTREIADNLTHGLTMECFTFRKEALGFGEPHEIIRNARLNKKAATPKKKV